MQNYRISEKESLKSFSLYIVFFHNGFFIYLGLVSKKGYLFDLD